LAGCLLLTVAAGWVPLVARFYSGAGFAAKAVAMVAAAGALVIMLRPPLPVQARLDTGSYGVFGRKDGKLEMMQDLGT